MIALLLALIAGTCGRIQGDAWAQLWTELEALRSGRLSEAQAAVFRGHLGEALRVAPEGPRGALLQAALESLSGRDATQVARKLSALEPTPFTARELWFLADLLPRGPDRARVVRRALEGPNTLERWQVLLAWNTAVDEARALRLEASTLPIQLELHERLQDPSSACDLALTYRLLGRDESADQVLARAIEREEAAGRRSADLWETRGINALGGGDESLARDYLGRALAYGSEGAALLLARLDLQSGRVLSARQGFRALILAQPPPDWAWRGWGLSLLPAPHGPPRTLIPAPPNE